MTFQVLQLGILCSIFIYPLNTIKTRMQSNMKLSLKDSIMKKNYIMDFHIV